MKHSYKIVLAAGFAIAVAFYANSLAGLSNNGSFLVLAALFGAYMAMNIGANDVANNVGPAVGAGALTIGGAILIASIFEAAGALIAGGDVVGTIKKGIIDPAAFGSDPMVFVYAMSAALLSAALWLNLATWLRAPVSTTHSIVGGVMGAGIAAGGFAVVSWMTMGKIAASWVISPVMGGVIAAIFLYIIKSQILYRENKIEAAKRVVPILVALMTAAFIAYITLKGLNKVWPFLAETLPFLPEGKKPTFGVAMSLGTLGGMVSFFIVKMRVVKKVIGMENTREEINKLFTIPLIFAAALLSFAHGANDVANAIGPLAAVNDALSNAMVSSEASIPLWVMVVGGVGISVGLALFGPRLIRTVGTEITELDHVRAFSIMMAASLTVVIASQLGLPVSSTHIAVGAVFGVGFLREWLDSKEMKVKQESLYVELEKLRELRKKFEACPKSDFNEKAELSEKVKKQKSKVKKIKSVLRDNYVKRGMVKKIVTAWVITVPTAAALSAIIFYVLQGLMVTSM